MSQFEEKYIVQDLETHEFLYPDPFGDVGQTPNIKSAGHYDSREDAINAGVEVSTHSRPKAAGSRITEHEPPFKCFNSQPPEGGWCLR